MAELLPFEQEMLFDVRGENSLCITSKGIANDRLLANLVFAYSDTSLLVFVIGTDPEEEDSIIHHVQQYQSQHSTPENETSETFVAPRQVIADTTKVSNRRDFYLKGGVIFITTRILVVDMLKKRIPFESVTGIIVANAQRIYKDCHLAFILRLFRMNNSTGFITALSQNAQSFLGGFAKLERIMRSLFVTKLYLWPRFHASISNTLKDFRASNVVEMRIFMTPAMKQIQFALINLISRCLKDLVSLNSYTYSVQENTEGEDENILNTINVISQNLNRIIQANLDAVWFQLSPRARRLLRDIQLLKCLLFHLTELDAVSFYAEIKYIRDNVSPIHNLPEWVFWEPSDDLFKLTEERVFIRNPKDKNDKTRYYNIEINPKLDALVKLLKEIETKIDDDDDEDEVDPNVSIIVKAVDVVIIVEKRYAIKNIEDITTHGMDAHLKELKEKCQMLSEKKIMQLNKKSDSNMDEEEEEEIDLEKNVTLTQMLGNFGENEENITRKHNRLRLHYYEWAADRCYGQRLKRLLESIRPRFVIIYEPEMSCIRQLEVYQAIHGAVDKPPIDVYFFVFDGSAEEQRYLRNIQLEKSAFERLIKEKSTLAKSNEGDGTTGQHPDLQRGEQSLLHPEEEMASNSRFGGGYRKPSEVVRQVLVDMREFRSHLPACIHKMNIELEPVTLEIGDYLLTPETCVERKSVSDLIGSLNSGRLYNQAQVMTRYYKRSILLIEFDEPKSFNFRARFWTVASQRGGSSFSNRPNPLIQLAVLSINFPQLKLVWSPSPSFSAQIFDELKKGKEEPTEKDIVSTIDDVHDQLPMEFVADRYDIEIKEFLLALPGVTTTNVYSLMNKCNSIVELVKCTKKQLNDYMNNEKCAEQLHEALHGNVNLNKLVDDKVKVDSKGPKKFAYARRNK